MASSQISAFVIVLVLAGVQSAIVDLDEVCATGDTCVHPTLALIGDTPGSGKCRVQVGQACNDAGGLCVNGATCDSNVCTCGSIYTKSPDNKCTAPTGGWGLACTAPGNCTLTEATACTDGVCVCSAVTKAYVPASATCADIATSKVGFACTGTTTSTTCSASATTHLTCSTTEGAAGVCQCDPGYFPKKSGDNCVANTNSKIGVTCTSGGNECGTAATTFLECPSTGVLKCTCKTGYIGVPGGVCFPAKATLKGGCAADSDCTAVSGLCTQLTGFPKTCKTSVTLSGNCADTTTTACAARLTCSSNVCKTSLVLGDNCTDTATTACAAGLTCSSNVCKTSLQSGDNCTDTTTTVCATGLTCTSNKCSAPSGAGTVTLSISLLMLQLAACVWLAFLA